MPSVDDYSQDEARKYAGSIRAVTVGGQLKWEVPGHSGKFDDIGDAIRYVKIQGISRVQTFGGPGTPLLAMPHEGPQEYGALTAFARQGGLKRGEELLREARHVGNINPSDMNDFIALAEGNGFTTVNDDIISILRIKRSDGSFLSDKQVLSRIQKVTGLKRDVGEPFAKYMKRVNAIMSARGVFNMESGVAGPKIAVFETKSDIKRIFGKAAEDKFGKIVTDKAAYEGMIGITPAQIRKEAKAVDKMAAELEKELNSAIGGKFNRREQLSRISGLRKQAALMRQQAKTGHGLYNIRIFGGELVDLAGNVIGPSGSPKGNAFIVSERIAKQLPKGVGYIAHKSSIPMEASWGNVSGVSLDPHHASARVRLDVQTLSSNKDIFDIKDMLDHTRRRKNILLKELETGVDLDDMSHEISKIYHALKKDVDIFADPLAKDYLKVLARKRHARRITEELELYGGKVSDRFVAEGIMGQFYEAITETKGGATVPRFYVPDTTRAYIRSSAWHSLSETQTELQKQLPQGFMTYDARTAAIIAATEDVPGLLATAGGGDLDDALVSMLRWYEDPVTGMGSLRLINYRQPNALGEISVSQMATYDPGAEAALAERGLKAEAEEIRNIRGVLFGEGGLPKPTGTYAATLRARADEIAKLHLTRNANISDIQARRIIGKDPVHSAKKTADTLTKAIEKAQKSTLNPGVKAIIERALEGQSTLSRYSDAIMTLDTTLGSLPDDFFPPEVMKVISTELVIDSSITSVSPGVSAAEELDKLIDNIGSAMAEHMAYGRAGYKMVNGKLVKVGGVVDRVDMGLDPYMWRQKGYSLAAGLNQGMIKANQALSAAGFVGEFDLDPTSDMSLISTKGYVSETVRVFEQQILGEADDVITQAGKVGGYSDEIMDEVFRTSEYEDAEKLLEEHRRSIRTHVKDARQLSDDQIDEFVQRAGSAPDLMSEAWQNVTKDYARSISHLYENTGTEGPKLYRTLAAAMQIVGDRRGRGGGYIFHQDLKESTLDLPAIGRRAKAYMAGPYGSELAADLLDVTKNPRTTAQQLASAVGAPPGSAKAAAQKVASSTAASVNQFQRFGMDSIKRLGAIPGVKKGAWAAAGLIGFSALYQRFNDRTPEDLAGPPLLPGGSAYETQYSTPPMPQAVGNSMRSSSGGVTYKVIARGNHDPQAFQSAVEGITGTRATGTTYSAGTSRSNNLFDTINESF